MYGSHYNEVAQIQAGQDGWCIFCKLAGKEKKHKWQLHCESLKNWKDSVEKLWKFVKSHGITCYLCLAADGHRSESCPGLANGKLQVCNIPLTKGEKAGQPCGKKHCRYLHFEFDAARPRSHGNRKDVNKDQNNQQTPGGAGAGQGQETPVKQPAAAGPPVVAQPGTHAQQQHYYNYTQHPPPWWPNPAGPPQHQQQKQ